MRHHKPQVRHKHFLLDQRKIQRAQKALGTRTETETIEKALEEAVSERKRNRSAWAAHERFIRSGIRIKDVYGVLEE